MAPGVHGQDVPYTFFNGDTSLGSYGRVINEEVAETAQRWIVNFVMHGNPSTGVEAFAMYGYEGWMSNVGDSGQRQVVRDLAKDERCAWWQTAFGG